MGLIPVNRLLPSPRGGLKSLGAVGKPTFDPLYVRRLNLMAFQLDRYPDLSHPFILSSPWELFILLTGKTGWKDREEYFALGSWSQLHYSLVPQKAGRGGTGGTLIVERVHQSVADIIPIGGRLDDLDLAFIC